MRRDSFELTESLLPENPLEGLDPEPDVLANITARARAKRRGEDEVPPDAPPPVGNQRREDSQAGSALRPSDLVPAEERENRPQDDYAPATELNPQLPDSAAASESSARRPRPPHSTPKKADPVAASATAPEPTALPEIDLDDPDLMSGTHATTLRADWEIIQSLKRMARDLSRPRKECTMGMLILHALKQTYPEIFKAIEK
jgi:hypothetical protein